MKGEEGVARREANHGDDESSLFECEGIVYICADGQWFHTVNKEREIGRTRCIPLILVNGTLSVRVDNFHANHEALERWHIGVFRKYRMELFLVRRIQPILSRHTKREQAPLGTIDIFTEKRLLT
jgi:hypothetical protein